ncbi:MAG: response regulator [Candidatus Dojkabacteria bacterium]|uniref:Transcriptional regulatory protein YycF n=1 Tax=candidate division WS6 bacterium OLB21 TaxID=1617427 RepID=A0A136KKI7_9BACT|nr:MAG: Transcriptional regulatory protein YycF [candidate division WS6 bacterium OLB21]WKZ28041.1 MAG: response regulator [Candidatus Dojkabacteria bacterium]
MDELKKVLVVEDEPDARQIFLDVLSEAGFDTKVAADGVEALELMQQNKFDLVLLDIIMPNMDGVMTLAEAKKYPGKYGDMKIVMLSNIGGDVAIDKALKLGADGYMLKSETEPDDLIALVKNYLGVA